MDIVNRAKNMIMSPKTEWPVVAAEHTEMAPLYSGYITPLAAIPPVATLIGQQLFFSFYSFGAAITGTVAFYVLSLIMVYVIAWIAGKLAAMFGGRDDIDAGLKLVAYGSTATWVGGVFHIIPALGIISFLVSIYGIYIFYTGVSTVMGVPQDRVIGFMVALVVAVIVATVIVGVLVRGVMGFGMMGPGMM